MNIKLILIFSSLFNFFQIHVFSKNLEKIGLWRYHNVAWILTILHVLLSFIFIISENLTFFILYTFFIAISEYIFVIVTQKIRQKRFSSESLIFLEQVLFYTKAGLGFKESLRQTYQSHIWLSNDLKSIVDYFLAPSGKGPIPSLSPQAHDFFENLLLIAESQVMIQKKLESLYRQYYQQFRLKKKIDQAKKNPMLQLFIICAIYIGFIFYQMHNGWPIFSSLSFKFSLILFILGVLAFYYLSLPQKLEIFLNINELLTRIIFHMESGLSVSSAVRKTLKEKINHLTPILIQWLTLVDNRLSTKNWLTQIKNAQIKNFILLLQRGFDGQSILTNLLHFQEHLSEIAILKQEEWIATLNTKLTLPLILLILPSYLLLIVGPILEMQLLKILM